MTLVLESPNVPGSTKGMVPRATKKASHSATSVIWLEPSGHVPSDSRERKAAPAAAYGMAPSAPCLAGGGRGLGALGDGGGALMQLTSDATHWPVVTVDGSAKQSALAVCAHLRLRAS